MRSRGNKEYYEWSDFWYDAQALAKRIKKSRKKLTHVYGIPRGGLIPAVCLSHLLDLPLIIDIIDINTRTLLVDDIVDTGKTLQLLRRKLPFKRLSVAALYYEKNAITVPQFWVRKKTKWVIFPWETETSSKYDFTLNE
jgi:hypoxanthine phosphoribosyltransferase